jgi:hypothetical protein
MLECLDNTRSCHRRNGSGTARQIGVASFNGHNNFMAGGCSYPTVVIFQDNSQCCAVSLLFVALHKSLNSSPNPKISYPQCLSSLDIQTIA